MFDFGIRKVCEAAAIVYDFRLRLIPIRQILRQVIEASSQVRDGRTELFRQRKECPSRSVFRRMQWTSRATGSLRHRPAFPGRPGSRVRRSRGRLRLSQRRLKRRWSPVRTRRKVPTGRAACACSDGKLCETVKTSRRVL